MTLNEVGNVNEFNELHKSFSSSNDLIVCTKNKIYKSCNFHQAALKSRCFTLLCCPFKVWGDRLLAQVNNVQFTILFTRRRYAHSPARRVRLWPALLLVSSDVNPGKENRFSNQPTAILQVEVVTCLSLCRHRISVSGSVTRRRNLRSNGRKQHMAQQRIDNLWKHKVCL